VPPVVKKMLFDGFRATTTPCGYGSRLKAGTTRRSERARASTMIRHTPRMRGIQYAAAFRFHRRRPGVLDHPPSRVMTAEDVAQPRPTLRHGFEFQTANDAWIRLRDPAAQIAPGPLLGILRPLRMRAQGKPGARCTRGLACKMEKESAHEHTGSAEAIRPSLRNGFNGLLRDLPGDRAFLSPSLAALRPARPVGPPCHHQLDANH
jgi:hypothetical protein